MKSSAQRHSWVSDSDYLDEVASLVQWAVLCAGDIVRVTYSLAFFVLVGCVASLGHIEATLERTLRGKPPLVGHDCSIRAENKAERVMWLVVPFDAEDGLDAETTVDSINYRVSGNGMYVLALNTLGKGGFYAYPIWPGGSLVVKRQAVINGNGQATSIPIWLCDVVKVGEYSGFFEAYAEVSRGDPRWSLSRLPLRASIEANDWTSLLKQDLNEATRLQIALLPTHRASLVIRSH